MAQQAEDFVTAGLWRRGFVVVARNWRRPRVEIDIVAWTGRTLLVIEVKGHVGDKLPGATLRSQMGFRKLRSLRRGCAMVAQTFGHHALRRAPTRIDFVWVRFVPFGHKDGKTYQVAEVLYEAGVGP